VTNQPWLPYIVTDYIKQFMAVKNYTANFEGLSVFEWGSGESTLFFFDIPFVNRIVSIEHDKVWSTKVGARLGFTNEHKGTINCYLIPFEQGEIGPDKANPHHYKSGSTELGAVNFKRYTSVIDDYGKFDLILIDGMARASCLYHAFNHVNPGGCIVLDNTGDRPYYLEQTLRLFGGYEAGWERVDFFGYGPILDYKWQTTFFINRVKADYERNSY